MKKISIAMLAILFAASTVMATDKTPVKKAKAKAATHKPLKKDKCVKGSAECAKKGC
jgi:hypothetical protein